MDDSQIALRNHNAENETFLFMNTTEMNKNPSLEASSTEQNLDTIKHSQPMHTNPT